MTTIIPHDLHQLTAKDPDIDVIDVRTPREFAALHATCATLHPLATLDPRRVLAARRSGTTEPVYLICHSGSRAKQAASRFAACGFANAIVVDGGTEAWRQAGLPVVRGRKAMALERQVRIAAGLLVLLGLALGIWVHLGFIAISAFVGAGLVFAGATDWCGMGLLLARMPWNRGSSDSCDTGSSGGSNPG